MQTLTQQVTHNKNKTKINKTKNKKLDQTTITTTKLKDKPIILILEY